MTENRLAPGDRAPAFNLSDQDGNKLEIEFEEHGTKRVIDSFVTVVG